MPFCTLGLSLGFSAPIPANELEPLEISGTPSAGTVSSPYTFTPTITGDYIAALSFSITSGALPPGLSINAGTGEISGTPT